MAKRKPDEPKKGSPEWMCTFSDLMNLLLCFFVLLFAMSSTDTDKWEQIVQSFNNAFSIFDTSSGSIGVGDLVGSGTTQLSNLDEYYTSTGQTSEDKGEDVKDGHEGNSDGEGSGQEGESGNNEGSNTSDYETLEEKLDKANRAETEEMLDEISEMAERYNIYGDIGLTMDSNGKYVEITISGSVLFDSGKAELKEECLPLLSKVGDILRVYPGHNVDIIGHTDSVPMNSSKYESNDILSSARAISAAQYLVDEKNIDINHLSWTGRGEYDPVATNATAEGRAKNRRVEIRIYNSFNSD